MKYLSIFITLLLSNLLFSQKQPGGLMLDKNEIFELVNRNTDYAGLIFKISDATSLEMEIYGVKWSGLDSQNSLKNDTIKLTSLKALSLNTGEITNNLKKFEFEFRKILEDSRFSFAFASRDEILRMCIKSEEYILLTGMYFSGGTFLGNEKVFFTFKIQPYSFNPKFYLTSSIGTPSFQILNPCPPFWWNDDDGFSTSPKNQILSKIKEDLKVFKCIYSKEKDIVELTWLIKNHPPSCVFTVYRKSSLNLLDFKKIGEVNYNDCNNSTNCSFKDTGIERDQEYIYKVVMNSSYTTDQKFSTASLKTYTGKTP